MSDAIEICSVSKFFGEVAALEKIDYSIRTGTITGLVGPDGAGKTTLLRLLAGLMLPSSGTLSVLGLDISKETEQIHEIIGYMPQRFGLYEDLKVIENLTLYADLNGITGAHRSDTFEQLLEFTRLAPFKNRMAGKLSGGMKQKLGLACALMGKPKVLLLDEPSVGVDPLSRKDLWAMVENLTDDGLAVIWSTAYLDEAENCEEVLLLDDGVLRFSGSPSELTSSIAERTYLVHGTPQNRRNDLRNVLDMDEVLDGVIQGEALRITLSQKADISSLCSQPQFEHLHAEAVTPRFEDAYIDLLGGGPGGRSEIAERMDNIPKTSDSPVECHHLTKKFGDFTATHDVTFTVKAGEIFGLLGPNGAGKSTTFKMLCGLLKPSEGEAKVAGFDLRSAASKAKLQLGYMAQKFSLYGLLSVRQNLEFFAGVYQLRGGQKRKRIGEMIETFGLQRYLKVSPDTLPLGYKQRLALACALMHRPPILFLDEPTSGVDPITRREFWTHINGLVRRGVTVLVTTHFMDEAEYCDRIALMYKSRVIALDTPDHIKKKAATNEKAINTMDDAFIAMIDSADIEAKEAV